MPVDPSIPLAAGQGQQGQFGPDIKTILTMQALAQRMQLVQQEQQGQNALRQLYGNPSNVNPQGMLTPEATRSLFQASPQMGMQYQQNALRVQEQKDRSAFARSKAGEALRDSGLDVAKRGTAEFQKLMDGGMSYQQAQQTVQRDLYDDWYNGIKSSGLYDANVMQGVAPNFDPARARRLVDAHNVANAKPITPLEAMREGREQEVASSTIQHQRATEEQGNFAVGTDQTTGAQYLYNKRTGETKPMQPPAGQGTDQAAAVASDVHGDDYLKALPSSQAIMVKALADGRQPFPSGFALRSPYWQRMLQQVSQYDPSFDAVNYNSRSKTRNDITSGKSAQNITAINTTIGHFGSVLKAGDALNNFRESVLPGVTALNTVKNWYQSNRGDPRVVQFEAAKDAVTRELTRVFRGSSGNVADIKDWEKTLNSSMTPEQLHGAISQGIDLLKSRIDAVGDQYDRGMNKSSDPLQLLSPKARTTLKMLPGAYEGGEAEAKSSSGTANMPSADDFTKSGKKYLTNPSTGETFEVRDGKVTKVP